MMPLGPLYWCWTHNRYETVPEEAYWFIVCPDCGHLYRNAKELRRAYRRRAFTSGWDDPWWRVLANNWRAMTLRVSRINACPECSHEF